MIYFRVDGNEQIATGHIMRCLSIAQAIAEKGENCTFIISDDYPKALIQSKGFGTINLCSKWNDLELEITKLTELIREKEINKMIIDSYFVTERYLKEISKHIRSVYIDDLSLFSYPVDLLINYTSYYSKFNYESLYNLKSIKLLLGCNYVPLRKEFFQIKRNQINNEVRNILITTGGSDTYNIAGRLLDEISMEKRYKDINFHVVSGIFNQNLLKLKTLEENNKNIFLYQNIKRMSDLMMKCDIAVSAGGTTLYELCACGLPTICFAFADNQISGVEDFRDKKIMNYAGDARQNDNNVIQNMINGIELLCENAQQRETYSKKMTNLVDGGGACRIAQEVLAL
ncbi:UDP-2,4-diacetamido-2,4,6-trideoxy-beta-L-altropyranose hydrolase [Anaerocolumna sp.]|uniref:UDP-2,4-diacetamido-2,4, 6-trideoxy-beta-L-altropyranose hydrolase n=1 Tax=Anaerocolumna sp. TaxID=2041569 RepID=UPI0028AEB997|nr:UDP-2,4-diacetamido-2,4,6-trideoxy-beta-L-altropyranose hydrolase [Anaerocolumna sp.]